MITDENLFTINGMDTPAICLRNDGRYLAYSQSGQSIMIGVYGSSEEEALNTYYQRLGAWKESIAESRRE